MSKSKTFEFAAGKRNIPDGLTNGQRADQAAGAVIRACDIRGEHGQIVSEDSIRDLLADLGHLCDREGLNFAAVINTAKKDWRSER